jgi:hypothetical protein
MAVYLTHFWALVMKRINYFKRDIQGLICEVFLPCAVVLIGFAILTISFVIDSPAAPLSLSEYPDYIPTSSLLSYSSLISPQEIDSISS